MYFSASQDFLGVVLSHGVNQLETDNIRQIAKYSPNRQIVTKVSPKFLQTTSHQMLRTPIRRNSVRDSENDPRTSHESCILLCNYFKQACFQYADSFFVDYGSHAKTDEEVGEGQDSLYYLPQAAHRRVYETTLAPNTSRYTVPDDSGG